MSNKKLPYHTIFYTEYTINNNNEIDFEIETLWGLFSNNDNGQLSTLMFLSSMTGIKYSLCCL